MNTRSRTGFGRAVLVAAVALAIVPPAAAPSEGAQVANPLGGGDGVALEPVPAAASPRRQRAVYVCHSGSGPVFADRPCGPIVTPRTLALETPRPGAPASTRPPPPRASTRPLPAPHREVDAAADAAETRCEALRRQVDELNDRMRTGYSAREAARLWQRWRDARERLRRARC